MHTLFHIQTHEIEQLYKSIRFNDDHYSKDCKKRPQNKSERAQ